MVAVFTIGIRVYNCLAMSQLIKQSLLLLFALLLPLQGFAAPFMALAHCGLPRHQQSVVAKDAATAVTPCHEQNMTSGDTVSRHDEGKLNCSEKSSCCHIAALPATVAVADVARPEGQVTAPIHLLYVDFLPEQPQRPPRLLPL